MPGKPKPMITRTGGRGNEGNVTLFSKAKPKSDDKKKFNPRTGEETDKPRGKGPRTIYKPDAQVPPERQMRTGGLSPKQKAIASKAPPPNKITGADFAVLKKEKAKGRGMGLQDESIKPGKVIKARDSKFIERRKKLSDMSEFQKRRLKLKSKKIGGVMKAKMGKAVEYKKYLKGLKNAVDEVKKEKMERKGKEFIKRRKALGFSKGGGADTGTKGEARSRVGVLANKLKRRGNRLTERDIDLAKRSIQMAKDKRAMQGYLPSDPMPNRRSRNEDRLTNRDIETASSAIKGYKSGGKTKKLKDDYFKVLGVFPTVKKKMGGGMMQRPMGYKSGTMIKARGCKLGRNKKTKLY